ncbi:MAG: hypothetical protein MZU97_07310 [Bacillus subtilis]|nr:hypothetical protein [Bacillus subtilis]
MIASTGTFATEYTSRIPRLQCRGRIPTALDSAFNTSDICCGLTATAADEGNASSFHHELVKHLKHITPLTHIPTPARMGLPTRKQILRFLKGQILNGTLAMGHDQ